MAESTSRVSRKKRRRDAKRATDAAFREAAVERAVKQSLTARPDAALFTLDKRGDDASREPKRRRSAASRQSAAVPVRTKRVSKSRPQAPSDLQVFDIWASAASSQPLPHSRLHMSKPASKQATQVEELHPSQLLAAVPPPHAGTSVNPSRDDHQEALAEILAKELASKPVTVASFADVSAEASTRSNDDEEAGSSEHSDDDGKDTTPRQRRRQEKFTRAKRNRLARTKAARRLAEEAKKAAAFNAQIERAALLAKQLEANSRQAARRSQLRKVAKRERLQQPKLLIGKKKVDPRPVLDVALSEELAHSRGSLRKAKVLPAQRLLQEKFASYRHRQLFETGRQRSQRKRKTKVVGERDEPV